MLTGGIALRQKCGHRHSIKYLFAVSETDCGGKKKEGKTNEVSKCIPWCQKDLAG